MGEFYATNHFLRNQLQAWLEEGERKKRRSGEEEEKLGDESEGKKEEGSKEG